MNRHFLRFGAFLFVVSLMGFGCSSSSSPMPAPVSSQQSAGPQPATFENLSPKDAALKVNLVASNVLIIHQRFTDAGMQLANGLGWGNSATTTVVISSFAPAHRAVFDWKRDTIAATGTKMVNEQFTGQVVDADLQASHGILSPSYWVEGTHAAFGSGTLWVSQDAYEDFTKSKSATFSFDLVEPEFTTAIRNPALQKAVAALKSRIDAMIAHKDVYLAKADAPSEWTLKLNGVDTKVQVIKVTSWFGSVVFLDNPQDPLVLEVRTDPKVMGGLTGFFDFDVTELQDLTQ